MKRSAIPICLCLTSMVAPAHARDRAPVLLPPEVVAQRVLQLSPGSGVFPGYSRPRLVPAYTGRTVIQQRGVPIGVVDRSGQSHPVGSYDDGRGGPLPEPVVKD
ncbi:hypothetical protein [Aureimonas frigidaquae]|uniref:hypothetical protein n=1 Tax=Aureimonas frigidaquae TaxID=424757 RepID=UPI000A89D091|nr:hypothetical protein [Aureimonas frigidaquae]